MSAARDSQLAVRARDGDDRAFADLVALHRPQLSRLARRHAGVDVLLDDDDRRQIVLLAVWRACRRHEPGRGEFSHLVARIAADALTEALREQRAQRRYPGRGALVSLDAPVGDDGAPRDYRAPSWHFAGANPADIVVWRDDLRRAWEALTDRHREILNLWLQRDGQGLTKTESNTAGQARRRALLVIDTPDIDHERRCEGCGGPLAAEQRTGARYCSRRCIDRAAYERRLEHNHLAAA